MTTSPQSAGELLMRAELEQALQEVGATVNAEMLGGNTYKEQFARGQQVGLRRAQGIIDAHLSQASERRKGERRQRNETVIEGIKRDGDRRKASERADGVMVPREPTEAMMKAAYWHAGREAQFSEEEMIELWESEDRQHKPYRDIYQAMLSAAPAASVSPTVPDGHVVVPVAPTEAMLNAGGMMFPGSDPSYCNAGAKDVWGEMVSTAPVRIVDAAPNGGFVTYVDYLTLEQALKDCTARLEATSRALLAHTDACLIDEQTIADLRKQLASVSADARDGERYRWLRSDDPRGKDWEILVPNSEARSLTPEELDAAIDAALARPAKGGQG